MSGSYNATCHLDNTCECIKHNGDLSTDGRASSLHDKHFKRGFSRPFSNDFQAAFADCLFPHNWNKSTTFPNYPCAGVPTASSTGQTTQRPASPAANPAPVTSTPAVQTPATRTPPGQTTSASTASNDGTPGAVTTTSNTALCARRQLYCDTLCENSSAITSCECDELTGETTAVCPPANDDDAPVLATDPRHPCNKLTEKCALLCESQQLLTCECVDSMFPKIRCAPVIAVVSSASSTFANKLSYGVFSIASVGFLSCI